MLLCRAFSCQKCIWNGRILKTRTKLSIPFRQIKAVDSKEALDIFRSVYLSQHGAKVNFEMTFCGKLNRGLSDQKVRIYYIYKFAAAYNRALIGFD